MEAIHTNALRIIVSFKELLDFLSSAIDTANLTTQLENVEKVKLPSDDDLKSYSLVFKMIHDLRLVMQSLENLKLDCDSHSETFRMSYKKLLNKSVAKYLAFYKDVEISKLEISDALADKIFNELSSSENKLKILEDLKSKYYKSKELIHVYARVMQRAIDELFATDKQLVFQLIGWVEEDKRHALDNTYQTEAKPNKANNPPQSRFGLLPMTSSMALKDLLQLILAEEKTTVDSVNLAQLSKKLKIGFIVFNSILYTPVEYNVRPLVNETDAKEYIQPQEYGINIKTIERFRTLSAFGNINKWDFSIEVHNTDAEKFYILETLDGKTYRVLAPWLSSTRYSVAKFRVQRILDYSAKKVSKALNYHAHCISLATKNMFLGKALELENFENQLTDVESGKIQSAIADAVINTVDNIIKKEYKGKITTPLEVSDILHHPDIGRTFINSVVLEFSKDQSRFDAGKFPMSEILSSFAAALQTAGRRFVREVHNGYSREPLKPADIDRAIEKIHKVLNDSVELVVKLDDNLFTSNYYKYLILNYTG